MPRKAAVAPVSTDKFDPALMQDFNSEEAGIPQDILTGADFHDVSAPVPGVDSSRLRQPSTFGPLHVSEREKKNLGISDDEEVCLPRRPEATYGGWDDVEMFLDANPGGRIPIDPITKKPHYRGDNIIACRPKWIGEEVTRRTNERREEARKSDEDANPEYSEKELKQMREQSRAALDDLLFGSPTHGKSLAQAGMIFSADETKATTDRYLYHGRTRPTPSGNAVENVKDRAVEGAKAAARGRGGSYSMGASFDKAGNVIR